MDQTPAPDQTPVNVVNPSGEVVSVPAHQLHDALGYGYRMPHPQELQELKDKTEYGTGLGNELKTGAEAAASSATFGFSRELENWSGITTPEAQAARAKYNPGTETLFSAAGIAAPLLAPEIGAGEGVASLLGKLANPVKSLSKVGQSVAEATTKAVANPEAYTLANKILAKSAGGALGSAVEGSAYGLGRSVDEHALGDPDLNAEKILWNAGLGTVTGGVIGAPLGAVSGLLSKEVKAVLPAAEDVGAPIAEASTELAASAEVSGKPVPSSIAEIQDRVKSGQYMGLGNTALPQLGELQKAKEILPDLEFPPHAIQEQSLSNQHARDLYQTEMEAHTPEGQAMRDYEARQKQEGLVKTQSSVKAASGGAELTSDPVEGGERLIDQFQKQYQAEKEAVAPVFKKFNETSILPADPWELVGKVESGVPGAKDYLNINAESGKFELAPYQDKMGFSKSVYGDIRKVVDAANDGKLTLGELRNVRDNLGDHLRFDGPMRDKIQVSGLRKHLMDYMQDSVQKLEPDLELRDAFKRYAINEEKRGTLEYVLGGSLRDDAPLKKAIIPEKVLQNIFSDTPTIQAARDILGPQAFSEARGNYLSQKMAEFTDKGAFSSNKWGTFLKKNAPKLEEALADQPQLVSRLKALSDVMRILPDAPSINPSGTAKTLNLMGAIGKIGNLIKAPHHVIGEGLEHLSQKAERAQALAQIDAIMKGASPEEVQSISKIGSVAARVSGAAVNGQKISKLGTLERMANQSTSVISSGVKSIFKAVEKASVPIAANEVAQARPTLKRDFTKTSESLQALSNDPQKLIDTLDQRTRGLYAVAPNIAGSLHQTAIRAASFLQSKLPQLPPSTPLGPKFQVSPAQIAQFHRYADIVDHPIRALDQLKAGTITPETMETLAQVYPKILGEMQSKVMEELQNHIAKQGTIPYRTKLSLSLFLGQDLDGSLDPASIQSSQMALSQSGSAPDPSAPIQAKVTQKGLSQLNQSTPMLTAMQASSQRKET